MTVPSLPDTLRALHQRLPGRVTYAGQAVTQVLYAGAKRQVRVDEPESLVWLEMALREECDARGWHWDVGCGSAEVGDWDRLRVTVRWHDLPGGTPAYALAVAALRWIEHGALGDGP